MKVPGALRDWHAWISVVLAVPVLIVGLTAIFIAHDKALGLKEIPIDAGWLPGYGSGAPTQAAIEIRAIHLLADGGEYLGTKQGLYVRKGDGLAVVEALRGVEIRGLAQVDGTLFAAAKNGIWRLRDDGWLNVLKGEAWSVQAHDGGVAAALKDRGILVSGDGGATWKGDGALQSALARHAEAAPPRTLTLGNLVMDLHTGKALVPGGAHWIWIDAVGAVMVFLGLSGLVLWWRTRRLKLKMARAAAPAAA